MFGDLIPFSHRRNQRHPVDSFHREIDRLFDEFWRGFPSAAVTELPGTFAANVDISEDDNAIQVVADLPGIEEKDIDVTLKDGILTIRGEKKEERERKDKHYHLMERSCGSFQRSIPVGEAIDEDGVKATFRNGVLTVTLPKSEKAVENARRIEIRGA